MIKRSGHSMVEGMVVFFAIILVFAMLFSTGISCATGNSPHHLGLFGLILCIPFVIIAGFAVLFMGVMSIVWCFLAFMTLGWKLTKFKCFDPGSNKTWF